MTPKQAKQQQVELTEQERQFVSYYAKTGNGPEAVKLAFGDSFKQPRNKAFQLKRKHTIRDAIAQDRARLKHEALAREAQAAAGRTRTREAALEKAWRIVEAMDEADPKQAYAALAALDRLAKAEGWDQPTEHRSVIRYEVQHELAAALLEAARLEVGEEAARRIVLRLAGKPVERPALPGRAVCAEWEPGE